MPVTWELRDRILVVRLVGNYDYDEPANAVGAAMRDPTFQAGTMLLVDARQSTSRRSSEELRERAIWMSSLTKRGMGTRCALVINSQPHQFGIARMAAAHIEPRGMQFEIFTEMTRASEWLQDEREDATNRPAEGQAGGVTRTSKAQF